MSPTRGPPLSLILLVPAALGFALQALPFVGIIMVLFLAPWWPIVLVNLAMAGIIAEAAINRVSRLWLSLPLAWFGIYAAATTAEHTRYFLMRADIEASNRAVQGRFDVTHRALIVSDENDADRLIDYYNTPVVYTPFPAAPGGFLAHIIADGAVCDASRLSGLLRSAGVTIRDIGLNRGAPMQTMRRKHTASASPKNQVAEPEAVDGAGGNVHGRRCNLSLPERPPAGALVTATQTITEGQSAPLAAITQISWPDGAGGTARLRLGSAHVLSWFPLLTAGCWLECRIEFARSELPLTDAPSAIDALAQALALRPRQPGDHTAARTAELLEELRSLPQQILAEAQAALDRILSGAEQGEALAASLSLVQVLRDYPDLVAPRLPAMVRAIENPAFNPGSDDRNSADRRYGWLTQNLPAPQLHRYLRQRLASALATPDGDSADQALAPIWVNELTAKPITPDDIALFWGIIADHRIAEVATFIRQTYGNEGTVPGFTRKILVDRILDMRTSPRDRISFTYWLTTLPSGSFADMTADERRMIEDPAIRDQTSRFVPRLGDMGAAGLPPLITILRRVVADPYHPGQRRMLGEVQRGLMRIGPAAAPALPEIVSIFNQNPSPLTSRDGTVNNARAEHAWRLTMARLGLPLAQLPYPPDWPEAARQQDRESITRELVAFDPAKF